LNVAMLWGDDNGCDTANCAPHWGWLKINSATKGFVRLPDARPHTLRLSWPPTIHRKHASVGCLDTGEQFQYLESTMLWCFGARDLVGENVRNLAGQS